MEHSRDIQKGSKLNKKRADLSMKFKTEMCRNWTLGTCTFAEKCAFAHGTEEIRNKLSFSKYKTKDCKQFHELGFCQYGSRCQFKHRDPSEETASNSPEREKVVKCEVVKKRLPVFAKLAP